MVRQVHKTNPTNSRIFITLFSVAVCRLAGKQKVVAHRKCGGDGWASLKKGGKTSDISMKLSSNVCPGCV